MSVLNSDSPPEQDAAEYADIIMSSEESLLALINEFLTFQRWRRGSMNCWKRITTSGNS
jgi:signal transduction histidine kinase